MPKSTWTFCLIALALAAVLAVLAPLASSRPDGLESVIARNACTPLVADQPALPQAGKPVPPPILAALAGTLAALGAMLGAGGLLVWRRKSPPPQS